MCSMIMQENKKKENYKIVLMNVTPVLLCTVGRPVAPFKLRRLNNGSC